MASLASNSFFFSEPAATILVMASPSHEGIPRRVSLSAQLSWTGPSRAAHLLLSFISLPCPSKHRHYDFPASGCLAREPLMADTCCICEDLGYEWNMVNKCYIIMEPFFLFFAASARCFDQWNENWSSYSYSCLSSRLLLVEPQEGWSISMPFERVIGCPLESARLTEPQTL